MLFYIRQQIDEVSDTDLTLFRSASPNIKQLCKFSDCREKQGLEVALPLFSQITFKWAEHSANPIGDIMSGSIFSPRAAEIILSLHVEYDIFESISIEGIAAIYVLPRRIDGDSDSLDMFDSKKYRMSTVVSQRFKDAWEAAGLLGAAFDPIIAS